MTGIALRSSSTSVSGVLPSELRFGDVQRTASSLHPDAEVQSTQADLLRILEHIRHDVSSNFITILGSSSAVPYKLADRSSAAFSPDGPAPSNSQAYRARISTLREAAMQEGDCLNYASEFYFWHFVNSEPLLRKGNLVLVDNGNLRAIWKDGQGTHLGLQFLDDGMIQYVIFKQRVAKLPPSRVAGRDTADGIWRQIRSFDLASLIYE